MYLVYSFIAVSINRLLALFWMCKNQKIMYLMLKIYRIKIFIFSPLSTQVKSRIFHRHFDKANSLYEEVRYIRRYCLVWFLSRCLRFWEG